MNVWVWLDMILLALVALLLVSYLRLETLLSERAQIFRLRWLGNHFLVDVKAREMRW